jgi:MFS family permease
MHHHPERRPSLREVFANRNFAKFWLGQIVSYLGDRIDQMAMIAVVSAGATAARGADHAILVTFWATLPYVMLSPFAGPLIDRFDRRRLMVLMDLLRAGVVLAVPFLLHPQAHPWAVYAVVGMIGAATCVFAPAKSAFIPEIVPRDHLLRANSVTSTMGTLTVLVGTVVGGKLVVAMSEPNWLVDRLSPLLSRASLPPGLALTLAIDCATYLFSALMLLWIRMPAVERLIVRSRREGFRKEGGFLDNVRDGFLFLRHTRLPAMCVALDSWFFLVGGILFSAVTKLVYLRLTPDNPAAAPQYLGYAYGALGAGLAAGGVATGRLAARVQLGGLLAACFAAAAAMMLVLALPLPPAGLYAPLFLVGLVSGGVAVCIDTALQKSVPDEIRGRVFSLNSLLLNATLLVSVGCGSLMLRDGALPVGWVLAACAVLAGAGGALALAGIPRGTTIEGIRTGHAAFPGRP